MPTIRYPTVHVRLTGHDDNALAILGAVARALEEARVPRREVEAFTAEALAGDYQKVLQAALSWITVR